MTITTYRSRAELTFRTVSPGTHVSVLRRHDGDGASAGEGGFTALFRMDKGAHAPHHDHPGGEETYLVSGKLRVGSNILLPGDYLWTSPGKAHDGFAEEDSVFIVVLPGGIRVTEKAPE